MVRRRGLRSSRTCRVPKQMNTPVLDKMLQVAVAHGHVYIVSMLLEAKADPRTVSGDGTAALHLAIAGDQVAIAGMLLDAKADPAAVNDDGETALHAAVKCGHNAIVSILLGAALNAETFSGFG